jgi:hypothetical protein
MVAVILHAKPAPLSLAQRTGHMHTAIVFLHGHPTLWAFFGIINNKFYILHIFEILAQLWVPFCEKLTSQRLMGNRLAFQTVNVAALASHRDIRDVFRESLVQIVKSDHMLAPFRARTPCKLRVGIHKITHPQINPLIILFLRNTSFYLCLTERILAAFGNTLEPFTLSTIFDLLMEMVSSALMTHDVPAARVAGLERKFDVFAANHTLW